MIESRTVPAMDALARLREGNRRFVSGSGRLDASVLQRAKASEGQAPFAVILGCSDSRVPAEIVFDQGFGDLFVIRVAGNVVTPTQAGSVELAVEQFGTRLVVVLGHTRCGAVLATLDEVRSPGNRSPNLAAIVGEIRPTVESLIASGLVDEELTKRAVRANIQHSLDRLRRDSNVIQRLMSEDGLALVGAEYSLETGTVEFFDGAAATLLGAPLD